MCSSILFVRAVIVLLAVQDSGHRKAEPAFSALYRLTGRNIRPCNLRCSLSIIGYYGGGRRPRWVRIDQNRRRKGPSEVSSLIRLGKRKKNVSPFYKQAITQRISLRVMVFSLIETTLSWTFYMRFPSVPFQLWVNYSMHFTICFCKVVDTFLK